MTDKSRILHRSLSASYPIAESGEGCYIRDSKGKQYLDASGGAAVSCLGHSHPRIIEAIKRQVERLEFAHTSFFTSAAAEELAERLSGAAPRGQWRVFFTSGGSEATEAALKLARQLWVERGQGSRDHFFSRWHSYHGNTLGALSVSGNKGRRKLYDPILVQNVRLIEPCFAYRYKQAQESEEDYAERSARSLDEAMTELGEGRAIAFIAETVVGATLGAVPAVAGYFKAIRSICDRHGAFLIADEVMCGMGRCGKPICHGTGGDRAGHDHARKGARRRLSADRCRLGSRRAGRGNRTGLGRLPAWPHLYRTCGGGSGGIRSAEGDRRRKTHRARAHKRRSAETKAGGRFRRAWAYRRYSRARAVAGARTRLRQGKQGAVSGGAGLWAKIKSLALEEGLICYPGGGTADGINGDHVLLAPPYIVSDTQLDEIIDKLGRAIERALQQ
jgi:adenosylmethionine-8-amino-7-oxononanoate aminotransferase